MTNLRYTVQYIPLQKIKPGLTVPFTQRIRELRRAANDCMHLLIVRKSRKAGGYVILSGNSQFEYIQKHTKKTVAPCLVDESKTRAGIASFVHRMRKRRLPHEVPYLKRESTPVGSWTIIRRFMKQEPRFARLTRGQQVKVLRLGLQYKRTTLSAMRAKVDELLKAR